MKKTFLITAISLMALLVPSFADSQSVSKIDTSSLNLQRVESVPENITPIVINSQEEFNSFVEAVTSQEDTYTIATENVQVQDKTAKNGLMKASLYSSNTVKHTETLGIGASINVYTKVDIYSSGSFGQINSAKAWSTLTGYTPGIEWAEKNVDPKISSDKQSVTTTVQGTLRYYLLVDGAFNLWNEDKTINAYYHL